MAVCTGLALVGATPLRPGPSPRREPAVARQAITGDPATPERFAAASPATAEAYAETSEILDTIGVKGGLIVHVGCGDGTLTAALRANDRFLVHGLDIDPNNVRIARNYIKSLGLYGKVSVDTFDGESLPYIDNLVNLVVSEDLGEVSMEEVLRVLCPLGVAYIRPAPSAAEGTETGWLKTTKPWPDNIDEWTHYLHDATNNAVANDTVVGPPMHMHWLSEPLWSRHHDKLASISTVVTAQGRLFYISDEGRFDINGPAHWFLTARDAFSGIFLWKRPISSWTSHLRKFRSGPVQLSRLLVANGDLVYVTLGLDEPISVLDARTGEVINVLNETEKAEEFILHPDVHRDTLIAQIGEPQAEHALIETKSSSAGFRDAKYIIAVHPDNDRILWRWPKSGTATIMPLTLAASVDQVYLQDGENVVCLDLNTGNEIWSKEVHQSKSRTIGWSDDALVVHEDVVLSTFGGAIKALSTDNGNVLWTSSIKQIFGKTQVDVLVAAGLVWTSPEFSEGRNLHTGEVVSSNSLYQTLITAGHHHRCYRNKATQRYLMVGKRGIDFFDLDSDPDVHRDSRNNWVRGTCQYGILPANGLVYAPTHVCGCYPEALLHGFWSLAPEIHKTEDRNRKTEEERLEKGPAYYETRVTSDEQQLTSDWPLHRHDSLRSGVTAMEPPSALEPIWKTQIPGKLSAPVIAEAIVLVCSVDAHCVYALDAQSGDIKWTFTAGGRVDSAPSIYRGKALFGSSDGWVYCLRLTDGELVWRFQAAPEDIRTVCLEQIESLWPVHGSVLVKDGTVYCTAGRSSYLDGGIWLYALDPDTGEIKHNYLLHSEHPGPSENTANIESEKISQNTVDYKTLLAPDKSDSFSMEGNISDILVSDGEAIYLRHMKFNSNLERDNQWSRHLFCTSSLLDDSEAHRSHWFYGLGDFSRMTVAYEWLTRSNRSQFIVPFGRLLVYDSESVWGVRRSQDYSNYTLFCHDIETIEATEGTEKKDFRPKSSETKNPDLWKWSVNLPIHPLAMLKAGSRLVIAGSDQNEAGLLIMAWSTDGNIQAEYNLDCTPVWDGMAAANGKLYISLIDGSIVCFGSRISRR